ARSGEHTGLRIVGAVGQELKREEGVRRSTLPEVELDRVRIPRSVTPHRDEVDCEAPEHALTRESLADLDRLADDCRRIRLVGGEAASEVALAARSAQQLVMSGENLEPAERRDPELHARAAELVADDPLLDNSTSALELVDVVLVGRTRKLELHGAESPFDLGRRLSPAQVDHGV